MEDGELFMTILIGILFFVSGVNIILRPHRFYKSDLPPQQIERKKRIIRLGGVCLLMLGLALITMGIFEK
jgi:uncharacterized membrane protein HdeD (DUF308 family)